jgi:lactoylglutathione lyase
MTRPPLDVRLAHVALWTHDLERLRDFYVDSLGGSAGPRYHNPQTGFSSYFVAFAGGARLELMSRPDVAGPRRADTAPGYAHIALALGSRAAVDEQIERLRGLGVGILGAARVTGDGYYEAVIADPDGNPVELIA